ncbi:gp50 protein [Mycobacteroides abscessus subsp. abscessus]|uniref:GH25 family lysozyme n=1 Tax=Mycobacteroides abscessus TaxID=36809 RepID=UPI0009294B0B|nr:GH25 family lysozyme [Mycobacteroides abscessus]SIM01658.1 gp50 protein [Mycobacteroides abscessus subsp. abscessus]
MSVVRYWPLDAGRIVTSSFGPRDGGMHTGTDFGFLGGSGSRPVYAVQAGTVIYAGAAQGYGGPDPAGWLVIDSDDSQGGGVFEYGHIVREVGTGAKVAAGQRIGRINPDSATNGGVAPHLHLSYMPREYNPARKQDPMPVLTGAAEPGSPTPPTQPPGGKPVTIFGIDISNNNGVVDIDRVKAEGFQFVWAKVSEGASFKDTFWPRTRDWCRQAGLLLAGYHYVREGDADAQAETFVAQLGDKTIPAMLDFEDGSGGIGNFWAVKNAIEARGVRVALSYIPRWYWEKIGKPDLSGVPGLIQSSYVTGTGYASVLYPGDDNSRWAPFGGKAPDILQFTSQAQVAGKILDANAFRGTVEDLSALLRGGPTFPGEPEAPDYDRETWDQLRLRWEMLGWQTFIEAFAEVRDKVLGTNDHGKTGVRS